MIRRCLLLLIMAPALLWSADSAMAAGRVLHLYSKDSCTWQVKKDGPAGHLRYDPEHDQFSFQADKLPPATAFALVNHLPENKHGCIIAEGISDPQGHLQLEGRWELWQGKFWLVLREDVERGTRGDRLTAWHPDSYLFEERVLGEDITD